MSYGSAQIRQLYYGLPPVAKNFIATAYGLKLRRERYNKTYAQNLNFLRESQFWNVERLLEHQVSRVRKFLNETIFNAPFYNQNPIYRELIEQNAALSEFPILTKTVLQNQTQNFYHVDLAKLSYKFSNTSGTTGTALQFPIELQHLVRETAFRALHYEWGGVSLENREKVAFCAGHPVAFSDRIRPPYWVYDWSNNWLYFSSYHLTEKNLASYIRELERFEPVMLGGYPSSLYLLALAFQKFGTRRWPMKSVFVSSETLLDFQRAAIETAFETKVFNHYGNTEMCAHIAECELGELHLKLEHSAVEILNERNMPAAPGESARLVSTNFNNRAFPLVRYNIGDTVKLSFDQTAKCGRGGRILDEITGRIEDYIVTPDRRLVGRLDHLFKNAKNVREAQIYQETIDEVVLRIVKTENYDQKDEKEILSEAKKRLGSAVKIRFNYVEEIERTKNGKFRFVISKINQNELLRSLVN
jgi:phenylacetate-CoA ligase